ncbi:hypothetical protein ENHYD8BJ_30138 [Enhydrobacter sp. 8BJ]|nr:hypothetical protein ENHYD8BJ_30138 [Enhydrobacter sp. 8BJ]
MRGYAVIKAKKCVDCCSDFAKNATLAYLAYLAYRVATYYL